MAVGIPKSVWLVLTAVLVGCLTPMDATGGDDRGFEFGILGGFLLPDEDLEGTSSPGLEPTLGFRSGYVFSPRLGWFADALYSEIDTETFAGEARTISARTGLDLLFSPGRENRWFLSFAGGYMDITFDNATDYYSAFLSAGVGQRIWVSGKKHYRWELRGDHTLADDGLRGEDLTQLQFLVGLNWGPGGAAEDRDGDGIVDRRDGCSATPSGVRVDRNGCPIDSDGDGVYDGIDRCPETAPAIAVSADGCPRDSDGDGLPDGEDACPGTRRGAAVDDRGCRLDQDGDGVDDALDMCPNTREGVEVSASGCPRDSDGDGVHDGLDDCPRTARGVRVDRRGCPTDGDGDGVHDGIDVCPDTPSGVSVDADGCPVAAPLFEDERETLILEGVNFERNRAVLTASAERVLRRVAASLKDWPEVRLEIGGHTDSAGSATHNLELSARRAETVREFLIEQGIAADRLEAHGYGEAQPIADNGTREGSAANRRVELKRLR